MATSIPVLVPVTFDITLTNGEGSVVAISAVPTDKTLILNDAFYINTDASPDGLFAVNFYGAADGSKWLGAMYAADMGAADDSGSMGQVIRPVTGGVWYQATGDGDSNTQVVEVTLSLQLAYE